MKKKSPTHERSIVVGQPSKRPYGVKVRIHLRTGGAIGNVENASVPSSTGAFLTIAVAQLKASNEIPDEHRQSLEGRLLQLRRESIRQALKRLMREVLPDDSETAGVIDDAYALKSQIIHTGTPADLDVDLEQEVKVVPSVIRRIYAKRLHRNVLRNG